MGRKTKKIVEYFPHYTVHGKTLTIIDSLYGNDGYVLFYRMLELLGRTERHYYHFGNLEDADYFFSQVRVEKGKGLQILCKLADLNSIDKDLWYNRGVVWVTNFVARDLAIVYERRRIDVPKPVGENFPANFNMGSLKESIVEKSIVEESRVEEIPEIGPIVPLGGTKVPDNGISANINDTKPHKNRAEKEKLIFDEFRKKYPGTKRGLNTEFENFVKKHKNWREILPKLLPALEKQFKQRKSLESRKKTDRNILIPFWKHLKTWINSNGWEEEQTEDEPESKFRTL